MKQWELQAELQEWQWLSNMTGQVYDHEHIQLDVVWDAISLFCGQICIAVERAYVCESCSASAG